MAKWRGVLSLFLKSKKGYFDRIEFSSSSFPFKARSWIYFQLDLEFDFNFYLIQWFIQLFPFPHQIFISSYFHKYPNSSQTFQSFKISLIFLQQNFKIRIIIFSCNISCCFTLQTWKGNGRTGNWSYKAIFYEWISSSFHQHLCINLIVSWCFHKRSPSILKMKSHNW